MNTDTTEAAKGGESSTSALLCADIKRHLQQLAPHIKKRESSLLIQKSVDEIERLSATVEYLDSKIEAALIADARAVPFLLEEAKERTHLS